MWEALLCYRAANICISRYLHKYRYTWNTYRIQDTYKNVSHCELWVWEAMLCYKAANICISRYLHKYRHTWNTYRIQGTYKIVSNCELWVWEGCLVTELPPAELLVPQASVLSSWLSYKYNTHITQIRRQIQVKCKNKCGCEYQYKFKYQTSLIKLLPTTWPFRQIDYRGPS